MRLYFLLIISLCIISCKGPEKTKIQKQVLPKNLTDAIAYLNKTWPNNQNLTFKKLSESDAVSSVYMSTGLWIRNNWVRGDRDTTLVNYFNHLGIFAPDDISSIILISFHRKLNNRPLNIDAQVQAYKTYWKKIDGCEIETKKAALANYHKYKVGDSINILMSVDTSYGSRNATVYMCPKPYWKFDHKKDLNLKGKVVSKYFINDTSNVFFKVRINYMSLKSVTIFSDSAKVGSTQNFALKYLVIKAH